MHVYKIDNFGIANAVVHLYIPPDADQNTLHSYPVDTDRLFERSRERAFFASSCLE